MEPEYSRLSRFPRRTARYSCPGNGSLSASQLRRLVRFLPVVLGGEGYAVGTVGLPNAAVAGGSGWQFLTVQRAALGMSTTRPNMLGVMDKFRLGRAIRRCVEP